MAKQLKLDNLINHLKSNYSLSIVLTYNAIWMPGIPEDLDRVDMLVLR